MQKTSYNYQLSDEAEWDVEDGYSWYESKQEGLGEIFLEKLDLAAAAIKSNPTTYSIRYKKKVRAFVVKRFPYLILYVVNENDINVIAVFNTHQHPRKWKDRVK
ncbi:MAG: type II toxin-antitoxin system RelE/ParE family toxin [Bacteroidota bacterium]